MNANIINLNNYLAKFSQVRVIDMDSVEQTYTLQNGRVVKKSEFNQRMKKPHYQERFDVIYGTDMNAATGIVQSLLTRARTITATKRTNRLNDKLALFSTIRVISFDSTKKQYMLNNGRVVPSDLFKTRMRKPHYQEHFDVIYGTDISATDAHVAQLMRAARSANAKRNMEINGERVIKTATANLVKARALGKAPSFKKGHVPWHTGLTKDDHPTLAKMSKDRMGTGNPAYGISPSPEARKKQSVAIRAKIASGEFTPNAGNSRTHWNVEYNGVKYRSSWEAAYHVIFPQYEYETLRIRLADERVHIVDFYNPKNKTAVEIKPKAHQITQMDRLIEIRQVLENDMGITYNIVGEEFIIQYWDTISTTPFDSETLRKLTKAYNNAAKKAN
jgi:hypothetical protein